MQREHRIALFARRFRLLAHREEFLRADPEERVAATRRSRRMIPLSLHDQVQVIGSGELDRVCAGAVRRLSKGGQGIAAPLDALGHMEPDRLCGVYFALPKGKRRALHKDPVWDYNVRKVERGMAEAIEDIDEIATEGEVFAKRRADLMAEMSAGDQAMWERFENEQMRRLAGLDHNLSDAEVETLEQARRDAHELLTKGRALVQRRLDG